MAYKDGWMWKRFEELPDQFGSGDLIRAIGVTNQTICNWRNQTLFQKARIAVQHDNGRWEWDKHRLRLWLCCIGAIKQTKKKERRGRAKNPPDESALSKPEYPSREAALRSLQRA